MRSRKTRCSPIRVVIFAAFLASHIMAGLANATSSSSPSADSEQPQLPAAERRRSSTRSSWCNVDVVQFDDPDAEERTKTKIGSRWPMHNLLQGLKLSKFGKTKTKTNKKTTVAGFTLPPKTIAESAWIRGIPTANATTTTGKLFSRNAPKTKPPPSIRDIKSWHFDPLQYTAEALVPVFSQTLLYYDLPTKYSLDVATLDNFARRVMEKHDAAVPYHNWFHGVAAVQLSFCLLTLGGADEYLTDEEIMALLFGALIHDVGHPGTNNQFEVARGTYLAKKYNNQAVLEANSVDVAYESILTEEGCDIYQRLKEEMGREEEVTRILDLARDYVLATDTADHGTMLEELAAIGDATTGVLNSTTNSKGTTTPATPTTAASLSPWNKEDPAHRSLLAKTIIHTADISNPAAPSFVVARDWCLRISTEFHHQVEEEKRLGLPVTSFMDGLVDEYAIAKQQQGFYRFMALPLFEIVGTVLPKAAVLEQWALQNLGEFDVIVETVESWKKEQEEVVPVVETSS
mmetsp:Transcript_16708/g.47968  ORF Transcript_16708/g.47968 Transcript_16708/m.47968 type:complete len:517 (-) Transcript_16708:176-1726(-)